MKKSQNTLYKLLISAPMVCLLLAVFVIVTKQNNAIINKEANQFTFQEQSFVIKGIGSSDTIFYEDIKKCQQLHTLKFDGKAYNGEDYFNGDFIFKEIGEARAYYYPKVESYIYISTNKKNYIINDYSIQETKEIYDQIQGHMR